MKPGENETVATLAAEYNRLRSDGCQSGPGDLRAGLLERSSEHRECARHEAFS